MAGAGRNAGPAQAGVYLISSSLRQPERVTHLADSARPAPTILTPGLRAEIRRVAPFLCVGVVGLAVDAGVLGVLGQAGLSRPLARALSLAAATLVTFALNRTFTFPAAPGTRPVGRPEGALLRYGLVTLVAQGSSYGLFLGLVAALPALPALLALLVGAAAAAVVSFAGHRLFSFQDA